MKDKEFLNLIDEVEGLLRKGRKVPLSDEQCIVNRSDCLGILKEMRDTYPREISEAREIVKTQDEYVREARRKADDMKKRALQDLERLIERQEVIRAAQERAKEMIDDAQNQADSILARADQDANEIRQSARDASYNFFRAADDALVAARDGIQAVWKER